MFALSYCTTLAQSSSERAAYRSARLHANAGAPSWQPRDVATVARYRALAQGVDAFPILRQIAEAPGPRHDSSTPAVLGVPSTPFR